MQQSVEERNEKKKIAEKKRRERIKANSELHNAVKAKARERYYKKKARGGILVSEMTSKQKRLKQLRDRLNSKLYRERKKQQLAICTLQEDLVFCEDNTPISNDPLSSPPREPSIRGSSQRLSNQLKSTGKSTPPPDSTTRSVDTSNKLPNILPSCSKITPNDDYKNIASSSVPLPPKKLYSRASVDDCFSKISQSTNSATSSLSSIDSSPTASPRSQKISRTGSKRFKKDTSLQRTKKHDYIEKKLMQKRIEELKTLNAKYRKRLSRLRKKFLEIKNINNLEDNTDESSNNEKVEDSENSDENNIKESQLCQDIRNFYCRDDNCRMCAGKKEYVTKRKEKQQKRLLTDTMLNLHAKFLKEFPHHAIAYSHFCRLRPFYVQKLKDRETCQCRIDANMDLIIESLHRFNIISEKKADDVLNRLCCDTRNKKCLSRQCDTCRNKLLRYKEFDNTKPIHYWSWQKVKTEYVKDGQIEIVPRTVKQKVITSPKDVINEFEKQIIPYMQHVCNMRSQFSYLKNMKQN